MKRVMLVFETRTEAVESGTAHLVGSEFERIFPGLSEPLDNADAYSKISKAVNPYGDGDTSARIVKSLIQSR